METAAKPDHGLVLKQMLGAIRRLEMYPTGHPASVQAIEKPFLAIQEILKATDNLIISRVEGRIVVNGKNVEGEDALNRLLEEFDQESISSLTFSKSLSKEELSSFLSFFVKPLGTKEQSISLPDFIKKNRLRSIKVDQLRYELVEDDEVVVKTDVVEGADLKAQISDIMKDNPDLLREIFSNKPAQGTESDREVEKQIRALSDDDLLELMASSLGGNLQKFEPSESGSALNEVVDLVNKVLEGRERSRLLPRVKKMLLERGMVQEEHLDFLFKEKWLKSQEVLDELMGMLDKLGTGEVDFERLMFLWNRVISSEETEIILYATEKAVSKIFFKDAPTGLLATRFMERGLSQFIKRQLDSEISHLRDRLMEKIRDPMLPINVFQNCSRLLKITFGEAIRRGDFEGARKVLSEYKARLSPGTACPEGVTNVAQDFVREVTDESTLAALTVQIKDGVPFQNVQLIEEILESLDGDGVARKLLEIFTAEDRAARMSALRVLSRLGESTISAFSALLSDPGTYVRKEGSGLLKDAQWYKVRNVIYVLSNIPDREGISILSRLIGDSDVRVRLEVIKALEKISVRESVDALVAMLKDEDDEVRRRVISSLSSLGDKSCLEPLIRHLRGNPQDVKVTIAAIAKIGREESGQLLLRILREEGMKHLAPKQKDEVKIAVLEMSREINSTDLADEIEKFVKQRGKGLKKLLVKDKVLESANRALEAIRRKNHSHPVRS